MDDSRKQRSSADRGTVSTTLGPESFPPPSISLDSFLVGGADTEFRQLIYNVLSVSAHMLRARERFASYVGVTAPQYSMMVSIGEATTTTVGQIATNLHVSSPFVTAEIGKLIKHGVVKRQPNAADGRSVLLALTPKGMDLIRTVGPYRRLANDIIFGSFSADEAKQFARYTERLLVDCERALHELDSPRWQKKSTSTLQEGSKPRRPKSQNRKPATT